jgi:hypothetical protein
MDWNNPKVLIGIGAAVATVFAFVMYRKNTTAAATTDQSQLPAEQAAANYTVPPTLGVQVDNTGGLNFPNGTPAGTTITQTSGAAQSLPMGT